MRFSEAFKITDPDQYDWFDRNLTIDTQLFVDPLLVLDAGDDWATAHDEFIQHFIECYRLIAKATSRDSLSAKLAKTLLKFPEPFEFGLGYTAVGTRGSGAGDKLAGSTAEGIEAAISFGLSNPDHIEEIAILNVGIGADRISDAICNVLKSRFIAYTQEVARSLSIPVEKHVVENAAVDLERGRWRKLTVELPTNPVTGKHIILVPKRFLNDLPVINATSWMDADINEDLRLQLNVTFGRQVAKTDIVYLARQNTERVRTWVNNQAQRDDLTGYDFLKDYLGVFQWDRDPLAHALNNPITGVQPPTSQDELVDLVDQIMDKFKHYIEDQRGWALLFNDDKSEKREEAAQLVFLGMAQHYLRLFNVEVDREVELGRGPVDFKIQSGASFKLLIEIKKTHNGKFWKGLQIQLPSYLKSDDCNYGWFVAITYREAGITTDRLRKLPNVVATRAQQSGKNLRYTAVDATPKASASNQEDSDS